MDINIYKNNILMLTWAPAKLFVRGGKPQKGPHKGKKRPPPHTEKKTPHMENKGTIYFFREVGGAYSGPPPMSSNDPLPALSCPSRRDTVVTSLGIVVSFPSSSIGNGSLLQ